MNELVTFFMMEKKTSNVGLVGIGLTDAMIERLKEKTLILEEGAKHNKVEGTPDILLVHGKTAEDIVATVQKLGPNMDTEVRVL